MTCEKCEGRQESVSLNSELTSLGIIQIELRLTGLSDENELLIRTGKCGI